jgi:hypothetical protein
MAGGKKGAWHGIRSGSGQTDPDFFPDPAHVALQDCALGSHSARLPGDCRPYRRPPVPVARHCRGRSGQPRIYLSDDPARPDPDPVRRAGGHGPEHKNGPGHRPVSAQPAPAPGAVSRPGGAFAHAGRRAFFLPHGQGHRRGHGDHEQATIPDQLLVQAYLGTGLAAVSRLRADLRAPGHAPDQALALYLSPCHHVLLHRLVFLYPASAPGRGRTGERGPGCESRKNRAP